MAQIQKFQTGTGAGGIQPSKLKFKIDGNDFEKDEQFVKDQFEPVFNELVASKKAKARDKDLWRNSFQQYLGQAKAGTYELQSSAGEILSNKYTGAADAQLGVNGDGSTAKKTVLGEVLSPRQQSEEQRMAFINGLVGNRLIGAYNADTAAAKAKAEADEAKMKGDKRLSALDRIKGFGTGYGNVAYGKDFVNSPELIMDKWFDPSVKDSQRIANMSSYYSSQLGSLFDTSLDEYKDDADLKARFNGRSLDEVRNEARKLYDPTTGKFTVQAKTLKDFSQYANVLDTMGLDNPFTDRSAWDKMKTEKANGNKTQEQINLEKAEADASAARLAAQAKPAVGGLFQKNGTFYKDKDATELADGFINDKLYGAGHLYEGAYIGNNSVGKKDYWGPQSGMYVGGKLAPLAQYQQHFRELEKTGKFGNYLKVLDQRRIDADNFGNKLYGGEDSYQTADTIQDKDASDYILGDYKRRFTHAQNITAQFKGLKDAAIAFVRDDKSLNRFGRGTVANVMRIKGAKGQPPKTFSGTIKQDHASGEWIFIGEDGREIKEASAKLKGVQYNNEEANPTAKLFRLNLSNGEPSRKNTAAVGGLNYSYNAYKEGGAIEKYQLGGNIGGIEASSSTDKRHQQAKVSDILDSMGNSNYNLSSLDKWELGALAGDLTSVLASATGAGSVVAGGLGLASTATQFGVDIARDGVDAGDFGRLGMGLALDAASFVPGLGIASSSSKTIRTLGKAAKWLVPALTAAGVVNAAGIVKDVVSGKKSVSDLSVDDLRGLVNGIHGVMGTKRMLRQNLATENATVHSIQLKNGRKVPVTESDAAAINLADDKVAAAKAAIAKANPGMNVADIELAPTYKANLKFWKGGFRTATPDSNTEVLTNTSGTKIKSLDDFQGDSFSDKFMRNSINKALNRAPASVVKQYETDNNVNVVRKQFDVFRGDNIRKGVTITPRAEPTPAPAEAMKQLPSPTGNPEMGVFTNRISQNATPRPVVDNTSPAEIVALRDKGRVADRMASVREAKSVKAAERAAIKEKAAVAETKITEAKQTAKKEKQAEISKQLNMFNQPATQSKSLKRGDVVSLSPSKKAEGGILKAQGGVRVPFLPPVDEKPMYDISRFLPQRPAQQASVPFKPLGVLPELPQRNISIAPKAPVMPAQLVRNNIPTNTRTGGISTNLKSTSLFKGVGDVLKGIDPTTVSEAARALWTRNQNSKIDTRVERPLVDAPAEVSTPVRGNILLKQSFDNQANNVVQRARNLPTSDGQLATIAGLEASRNAGILRAQGDMGNSEAIEKSRGMALENEMRNTQARTNAANQNSQTLARATQAERGAQNEKMARMNQPIADFWKDQNYKSMVKGQQDKAIDTQIALTGKSGNFNLIQQPLQAKYSANQQKMASGRLSEAEIAALQAENAQIEQNVGWLNNQYVTDSLLTRKDSKYVTPTDWYTKGMPAKKEGGAIKIAIQNQKEAGANSRAIVKQHDEFIKTGLQDESKRSLQTMKQIQELIKLALS